MLHPSTKKLIDKLAEMTRKKRVEWDEGENGQIVHDTEGYRVVLTPDPHSVLLTDVLGKEIETCTADEIAAETDADGRPYAQFVAELYREASRHARGTERAIDAVLRGLDSRDEELVDAEPVIEIPAQDTIEDIADESDPEEYGGYAEIDAVNAREAETFPEIDGENEMKDAVASLAEQVNNPVDLSVASAIPDTTPAPVAEIVEDYVEESASETERSPWDVPTTDLTEPEPLALSEAEQDNEAVDEANETADETPSQSYTNFLTDREKQKSEESIERTSMDTEFSPEQVLSAGTAENVPPVEFEEESLIPAEPEPPTPPEDVTPVSEPQITAERSNNPTSAMLSGGFFGGGALGNLNRYMKSPSADTPAETAADETLAPATTTPSAEAAEPAFDPSSYDALTQPDAPSSHEAPQPVPPPEPTPQPQRRFSLSGLAANADYPSSSATEPAPEVELPVEKEQPRMVIDGTVDLPDFPAEAPENEEPDVELPSFETPLTSAETESDDAWVPKQESEDAERKAQELKPAKKSPFNPWS